MRRLMVLFFVLASACEAPPGSTETPIVLEPAPAEPEPAEPEPAEPEPAEPEPAEPEPVEPEPVEQLDCQALDLGAPANQREPGHFRLIADAWNAPIRGLCPVSDFSITAGPDAVFTYTARHAGRHHFSTVGGNLNGLSLHADCTLDEPLLCAIAPHYHDPDLGDRPLDLVWEMEAGETVLVFVDGFHAEQLGVEVITPVGAGAACGHTVCPETGRCPAIRCDPSTQCHEATCQVPPPPGEVGAECDVFARCAADLLCLDATCAIPPDPVAEEFWATWHAGRLFVEAIVFDPGERLEAPELRVGEAVVAGWRNRARHHWRADMQIEAMPATVQIVDGRQIIAEIDVVAQPEIPVGAACHRYSGLDRCALGSLCRAEGEAGESRCVAANVQAWRSPGEPDAVILDVHAPGLTNDERLRSNGDFNLVSLDAERWVGQQAHDGADTITVWHGFDLLAVDVPVNDPPNRREGEACDAVRVADICAQGTACIRGACEIVHAPIIDEALYIKTRDQIGIWVRGRDPNQDLVSVSIDTYEAAFAPQRPSMWWTSALTWDGDRFEGWLSDDADWRTRSWRDAELVVVDSEGQRSAPFPLDPTFVQDRAVGDEGAACDRIQALYPCAEGLLCDTRDDAMHAPTCVALDPACDAGLDTPIELDELLSIDAPGASNTTRTTCDSAARDLPEHRLRFIPERVGRFVIDVVSNDGYGLAVRRGCHQALSEIACVNELTRAQPLDGGGGHGAAAQLIFNADAGEQITILVDGTDRFDISVRRQ